MLHKLPVIFNQTMIENLEQINTSHRDHTMGVWYYEEYAAYCDQTGVTFNDDFETGYANPDYWEKVGFTSFKLKPGKKPSEAIKAFMTGFTVADCGNVLSLCQYMTLLKIYGEERFNLLFDSECASLLINQEPIPYFFIATEKDDFDLGSVGARPIAAGEFCFIEGSIFYPNKHPASHAIGFNVMCTGKNENNEDLFLGFGRNIFKKPMTEKELFHIFVEYYNLDKTRFDKKIDKLREEFKNRKVLYPEKISIDLGTIQGFLQGSAGKPNFDAIQEYLSISYEKIQSHYCNAMGNYYSQLNITLFSNTVPDELTESEQNPDPSLGNLRYLPFGS